MKRFKTVAPLAVVAALLAAHAPAAPFAATSVTFAPGLEDSVRVEYGAQELPVLRTQVVDAFSAALRNAGDKCNLSVDVIIERVVPSHPTMHQQLSNSSLDPVRSRFANGGAALLAHLRGADGRELSTVKGERFNDDDLRFSSPAADPWSDARAAIHEFADKVAAACERHSGAVQGAH